MLQAVARASARSSVSLRQRWRHFPGLRRATSSGPRPDTSSGFHQRVVTLLVVRSRSRLTRIPRHRSTRHRGPSLPAPQATLMATSSRAASEEPSVGAVIVGIFWRHGATHGAHALLGGRRLSAGLHARRSDRAWSRRRGMMRKKKENVVKGSSSLRDALRHRARRGRCARRGLIAFRGVLRRPVLRWRADAPEKRISGEEFFRRSRTAS